MIQQAIQVILTTIYVLFASPIAAGITPQGWYGLGAGLAALQFSVAFFFLPETKYDRSLSAYQETLSDDNNSSLGDIEANEPMKPRVIVCKEKPPLDYVNFEARTWKSDMRLWVGEPEWYKAVDVLKVSIYSISKDLASPTYRELSANFSTPLLPKRLLGPLYKWPNNRCQHCHRNNLQHNYHRCSLQLARLKRQLR